MGQLLWESGYGTVFVETQDTLVALLNKKKKYPLRLLDAYTKKEIDLTIDRFEAVAARDRHAVREAVLNADVMGTAVGVKNLAGIAPLVADGIKRRHEERRGPVDIYLCENVLDAAALLRKAVMEHLGAKYEEWVEENVGFVGTSVARMVPAASDRFGVSDPLFVVADSYHKFPYDGKAVRAPQPPIEGMRPVKNFKAEVERKLFTYNLGHAALAYLGHLKGYSYVHESYADGDLAPVVEGALDETGKALLGMYPRDLDPAGHAEVREDVRVRFGNPLLMDTVQRVGRDPVRKLGHGDRLVGSAMLCLGRGVFPARIATVCGAALHYDHPGDPDALALQSLIGSKGVEAALKEVCGLDPAGDLGKAVAAAYRALGEKRKEWAR
jgi:mannitol-1-phosphate 5-dehydrogenase